MLEEITKGAVIGWIVGPIIALLIALTGAHHFLHLGHHGHHGHSLVRTPGCTVMSDGNDRIVQCGRGNTVITSGNNSTSGVGEGNTGGDAYIGD